MSNKNRAVKYLRRAGLLLGLAILGTATFFAARWVLSLRHPENLAAFQQYLDSLGPGGWFLLLGIQYLQIVVAVIPGGPIQMVAGAMYGPVLGMATCVLGNLLATATVFYLVSRYGQRVVGMFVSQKHARVYRFVSDEKRVERLVVILFFIPGTPKDALTYLFAITPIRMARFMLLATLARMPAMLTSVLAGDSIADGEWTRALVLFIVITAISLAGLILHKWVLRVAGSRHGSRD